MFPVCSKIEVRRRVDTLYPECSFRYCDDCDNSADVVDSVNCSSSLRVGGGDAGGGAMHVSP